jgi:hypothetical protein
MFYIGKLEAPPNVALAFEVKDLWYIGFLSFHWWLLGFASGVSGSQSS